MSYGIVSSKGRCLYLNSFPWECSDNHRQRQNLVMTRVTVSLPMALYFLCLRNNWSIYSAPWKPFSLPRTRNQYNSFWRDSSYRESPPQRLQVEDGLGKLSRIALPFPRKTHQVMMDLFEKQTKIKLESSLIKAK